MPFMLDQENCLFIYKEVLFDVPLLTLTHIALNMYDYPPLEDRMSQSIISSLLMKSYTVNQIMLTLRATIT